MERDREKQSVLVTKAQQACTLACHGRAIRNISHEINPVPYLETVATLADSHNLVGEHHTRRAHTTIYGVTAHAHVRTHAHTYTRTHTHIYIYTSIYIYIYTYTYTYTYIYTYTYTSIYTYIYTYTYTSIYTYIYTYIRSLLCTRYPPSSLASSLCTWIPVQSTVQ